MRKNLFYLLISILIFANVFINVNAIPPATFTYNPISGVPGAAFTNPDWKTDSPGNFVVTFDANTQNNIYVHLYAHKVSQSYVAWQHGGYYYHVKIDPYQTDILCFNGETNKTTLTPNKSLKVSMGVKESWWISLKDNKTLTVGKGIYPNGTTASWTIPDDYALAATYFGFGGAGAPTYFENIKIISQTKDVQTAKKGRFLHRNSANNMYYFSGNTDANGQMAWKQIDGASKDIAITADGQMICVGMDDAIWYSSGVDANGKANWKKQNGTAATHVAARGNKFMCRNSANNMYVFSGKADSNGQMSWKQIDGQAKSVAIAGDGQMMCVGMDNAIWYSSGVDTNGKANWKRQNGTAATHVAIGGSNKFLHRNSANNMYHFDGKPDVNGQMTWKQIDGAAKNIALMGDGQMVCVGMDDAIYYSSGLDANGKANWKKQNGTAATHVAAAGITSSTSYTFNPNVEGTGKVAFNPNWKFNDKGILKFKARGKKEVVVVLSTEQSQTPAGGKIYKLAIGRGNNDYTSLLGNSDYSISLGANVPVGMTQPDWGDYWIQLNNNILSFGTGTTAGSNIKGSWTIAADKQITPKFFGLGGWDQQVEYSNIEITKQPEAKPSTDKTTTVLEYNKIVRIQSTFGGMVWTHPYYRDEKVKGTANDSLELLVNSADARATNGCDFFMLKSADNASKTGPVNYGDKIEIYSLNTTSGDLAYNKTWPLNRKWVANGDSYWTSARHGEVLIVGPENPKFKDNLRIFSIVSNSGKTGAINYNDEVRIVASLPNSTLSNDLWIGDTHPKWGANFKPIHIDDKTDKRAGMVNVRGIFKFLAPDQAKLNDPNGIAQKVLAEIGDIPSPSDFPADFVSITPKEDLDNVTVGSKDGKLEIWALDSNDKPYRFNEFAGAPYTMPDATIDPWELQTLKDESGKDIPGLEDIFATCDGNLFGIRSDDKTAVKYDFTKKQWSPLKVTNATKIKLENITASKGTEIFASSEDDVIYKLENNTWKKLTTGSSIAAGIGTDGKSIVIGIAKTGISYKFASNKWTPMGTEQLSKITIGNQNYILGITLDDRLVKWDSKTKKWMDIPGKKETKIPSIDDVAAIPSGTTVALDKFGNTYHKGSDAVSLTAKGVEINKATTTTVTTAVADKKVKTATTKKTVKTVSKKAAKKTVKKAAKKKLKKTIVKKTATTSTKRTSAKTTTPVKAKTASTTTTKSTATK